MTYKHAIHSLVTLASVSNTHVGQATDIVQGKEFPNHLSCYLTKIRFQDLSLFPVLQEKYLRNSQNFGPLLPSLHFFLETSKDISFSLCSVEDMNTCGMISYLCFEWT